MELQCKVQSYEWGKLGKGSKVAQFLSNADQNVTIDPVKPYAELWMGTHPNGPSLITGRNVFLSDYIQDNADAIGKTVIKTFGVAVPFLFKILSIRKALSIQAHPKKEHAEELHKNFPDMYKDPNHKPELAIALTPFEALCGFRKISQIQKFLEGLPELQEILPKDVIHDFMSLNKEDNDKVLKGIFSALMTCDKNSVSNGLLQLLNRLEKQDLSTQSSLLYPLIKQLHTDFPGDVGCWAPYFMNYLNLRPGQAIFLKPNLPHAYLSGDCVECMACSDNVVRAGLTPKHLDVETLLAMLDYTSYDQNHLLFTPTMEDANTCIWRPPVPDFAVVKIVVSSGESYNTLMRASPSLLIVTQGTGVGSDTEPVSLVPGRVLFLKALRQLTVTAHSDQVELYQAICNV